MSIHRAPDKRTKEMKLLSWLKLEIGVWEGIFEDFKNGTEDYKHTILDIEARLITIPKIIKDFEEVK